MMERRALTIPFTVDKDKLMDDPFRIPMTYLSSDCRKLDGQVSWTEFSGCKLKSCNSTHQNGSMMFVHSQMGTCTSETNNVTNKIWKKPLLVLTDVLKTELGKAHLERIKRNDIQISTERFTKIRRKIGLCKKEPQLCSDIPILKETKTRSKTMTPKINQKTTTPSSRRSSFRRKLEIVSYEEQEENKDGTEAVTGCGLSLSWNACEDEPNLDVSPDGLKSRLSYPVVKDQRSLKHKRQNLEVRCNGGSAPKRGRVSVRGKAANSREKRLSAVPGELSQKLEEPSPIPEEPSHKPQEPSTPKKSPLKSIKLSPKSPKSSSTPEKSPKSNKLSQSPENLSSTPDELCPKPEEQSPAPKKPSSIPGEPSPASEDVPSLTREEQSPASVTLEDTEVDLDMENLDDCVVQLTVGEDEEMDALVPLTALEGGEIITCQAENILYMQSSSCSPAEPIVLSSDDEETVSNVQRFNRAVQILLPVDRVFKRKISTKNFSKLQKSFHTDGMRMLQVVEGTSYSGLHSPVLSCDYNCWTVGFHALHCGNFEGKSNGGIMIAKEQIMIPLKDTTEQLEVVLTFARKELRRYSIWDQNDLEAQQIIFKGDKEPYPPGVLLFCVSERAAASIRQDLLPLCIPKIRSMHSRKSCLFLLLTLKDPLVGMEGALLRSVLDMDCINGLVEEHDEGGLYSGLGVPCLSVGDSLELIRKRGVGSHLAVLLGLQSLETEGQADRESLLSDVEEIPAACILDDGDSEEEPKSEPEVKPRVEPEVEPEPEVETELEEEPEPEVEMEAEPEVKLKPEVEMEAEVEAEPKVEAEPEAKMEAEAVLAAEPEMELKPEVEPKVEVEAEPVVEADPEVEMVAEPVLAAEPEMELKPEVEAEPKVELKPEVQQEQVMEEQEAESVAEKVLEPQLEPKVDRKEERLEEPTNKKKEAMPVYTLCHRRTKESYSVSLKKAGCNWLKYKHKGLPQRLILYPPPPLKGGIAVTMEDLQCLDSGQYLNDVIIDFYLKYLLQNAPSAVAERFHIFSSFFYKQLTRRDNASEGGNNESCQRQRRHQRVKTWTRHVDIFKKDFLFVPVNQEAHWYLVVVCFPGLDEPILEDRVGETQHQGKDQEEEPTKTRSTRPVSCTERTCKKSTVCKRPCILIMDSLKLSLHERVFKLLSEYLQSEWEARRGSTRDFSPERMKSSHSKVPLQDNSSDCGLYLLQYVECFLKDPVVDFDLPLQLQQWFPRQQVRVKRDEIRNLILNLYRHQKLGNEQTAILTC